MWGDCEFAIANSQGGSSSWSASGSLTPQDDWPRPKAPNGKGFRPVMPPCVVAGAPPRPPALRSGGRLNRHAEDARVSRLGSRISSLGSRVSYSTGARSRPSRYPSLMASVLLDSVFWWSGRTCCPDRPSDAFLWRTGNSSCSSVRPGAERQPCSEWSPASRRRRAAAFYSMAGA